jgi:enterobactin synthetase component D
MELPSETIHPVATFNDRNIRDEFPWLMAQGISSIRRASSDFFLLAGCRPVLIEFDASCFVSTAFEASHIDLPANVRGAVRKRQAEYFFGRAAARIAMEDDTPPFTSVRTGPMREPIWPESIVGSISHYKDLAVAVVMPGTRCEGIGIDAEAILSAEAVKAVTRIALDQVEVGPLRESGMDPDMAFTLAFSAKESFFKGAFAEVGRFFDFGAVRILAIDCDRQVLRMQVRENLSKNFCIGDILEVHYAPLPNSAVLTCFHY